MRVLVALLVILPLAGCLDGGDGPGDDPPTSASIRLKPGWYHWDEEVLLVGQGTIGRYTDTAHLGHVDINGSHVTRGTIHVLEAGLNASHAGRPLQLHVERHVLAENSLPGNLLPGPFEARVEVTLERPPAAAVIQLTGPALGVQVVGEQSGKPVLHASGGTLNAAGFYIELATTLDVRNTSRGPMEIVVTAESLEGGVVLMTQSFSQAIPWIGEASDFMSARFIFPGIIEPGHVNAFTPSNDAQWIYFLRLPGAGVDAPGSSMGAFANGGANVTLHDENGLMGAIHVPAAGVVRVAAGSGQHVVIPRDGAVMVGLDAFPRELLLRPLPTDRAIEPPPSNTMEFDWGSSTWQHDTHVPYAIRIMPRGEAEGRFGTFLCPDSFVRASQPGPGSLAWGDWRTDTWRASDLRVDHEPVVVHWDRNWEATGDCQMVAVIHTYTP